MDTSIAPHTQNRTRWILIIVILASASSLVADIPSPVRIVCGLLQALYLPGFVLFLYLNDSRRARFDAFYIPFLYSPIVLVLIVLAASVFAGSFDRSLTISIAIIYVLLIVRLLVPHGGAAVARNVLPWEILIVSGAFFGIALALPLANDYLLAWDTLRHKAIATEILYRGIPPLGPFFPDIPIRGPWVGHVYTASLMRLSGLTIIQSMWLFTCVVMGVFPFLVARIVSFFTGKRVYMITTPLFAMAGLGTVSWILWPLRSLRTLFGDTRNMSEIARLGQAFRSNLDSRNIIGALAPPFSFAVNTLERYVTVDIQNYALNLFLMCLIVALAERSRREAVVKGAVQVLIIATGAFLFHTYTGVFMLIGLILTGPVLLARELLIGRRAVPLFHAVVLPACAVLAAALMLPHFKSFRGVYADGVYIPTHITFNLQNAFTIALPILILFPFARSALGKIFAGEREECYTLGRWIIAFLIVSVLSDLTGSHEDWAVLLLFLILVIPVSWEIVDRARRASGARRVLLVSWILLLFLVPAVLTARGLILDKPKDAHHLRRYRITDSERALYEWIRDNTDIQSVIAELNVYNVMPLYADRRDFYMAPWEIKAFGHRGEKVDRYKAIHDELFSNGPIAVDTIEFLRSFPFDIYVVLWQEEIASNPTLAGRFDRYPEWFTLVYSNPAGSVYRLVKPSARPLRGSPLR